MKLDRNDLELLAIYLSWTLIAIIQTVWTAMFPFKS